VVQAFHAQRAFLSVVASSQDPKDANVVNELVKPTATLLGAVQEFREKNRDKRAVADHLAALAEGVPALGWVLVAPKPGPHVTAAKESAEFYTNRVLKEFKDKYAPATHTHTHRDAHRRT
jgi:adenylyl cyclase-associated protein